VKRSALSDVRGVGGGVRHRPSPSASDVNQVVGKPGLLLVSDDDVLTLLDLDRDSQKQRRTLGPDEGANLGIVWVDMHLHPVENRCRTVGPELEGRTLSDLSLGLVPRELPTEALDHRADGDVDPAARALPRRGLQGHGGHLSVLLAGQSPPPT